MFKTNYDFIDKKIGTLLPETITTIVGSPGIGKSTLCFSYINDCVNKGNKVIYIDTEGGFSVERILQISPNIDLNKIIVFKVMSFDEQSKLIKNLLKQIDKNISLIVIDSLVMLYRLKLGDEPRKINIELAEQLMILNEISRKFKIPILITNQVYTNFETKKEHMVGGNVIEYWSKVIINLRKENDVKKIFLIKHKCKKEGFITNYEITNKGFSKSRSFFF